MSTRALALSVAIALTAAAAAGAGVAQAAPSLEQDSLGPVTDVTAEWQQYQPAAAFCIKPDAPQYTPGGAGATATGLDPACAMSGFAPTATGLVKVQINTPPLCAGCRRLFIDFSKIPARNAPPSYYAHGHAYYHLATFNPTYTVAPTAHSPNTKNFTNDKLIAPDGSLQAQLAAVFDTHAIVYVADTANFVHNAVQGPYYVGPWYVNTAGQRIDGVYLDLDTSHAKRLGSDTLDEVGYVDGFNSGALCPTDADLLYGGCVDWGGISASSIDPFAPLP